MFSPQTPQRSAVGFEIRFSCIVLTATSRKLSHMHSRVSNSLTLFLCISLLSCHDAEPVAPSSPFDLGVSGPGTFTVAPINYPDFVYDTPLGSLNPPGHTVPTDHVYFYWVDPANRTPGDMDSLRTVYAPGSGIVDWMLPRTSTLADTKIEVKMTNTFRYYIDHLLLDSAITIGTRIKAGQRMGLTSPEAYAIDLGVTNDDVVLRGFIVPDRYGNSVHADSPYKYFVQPLRDSLYAKNTRIGPDKDGKIDYDIAGRLVGGWFLKGLPVGDSTMAPTGWTRHLAFVYDMNIPGAVRVSIGGVMSMTGVFALFQNTPDPAGISIASGKVSLKLVSAFDRPTLIMGTFLVQLIAQDTIRTETFPNLNSDTLQFDSKASIYTR